MHRLFTNPLAHIRSFALLLIAFIYSGNVIATAAPLGGDQLGQINIDNSWSTTACFTDGASSTSATDDTNLKQLLKKLADENNGTTAISVGLIEDDKNTSVNGDKQMATRSTYKIYVAYAILKAVKEGRLTWSSVSSDFNNMIINSDNDAADRLRLKNEVGGPSGITKLLHEKVGLSDNTVMGTGSPSNPAGTNSQSTSDDFVKFLRRLESRELPGLDKNADKEQYDRFLGAMKQQSARTNGIKEGVGNGTEVADKPGWGPAPGAATNDVGIVYLPNKKYAIAILTDYGNENWTYVKRIAAQVNDAMKTKDKDSTIATDGDSELDGHKLPATKGGTGYEDEVDASGHLTTTGEPLTFPSHVKGGQAYQDYYITMRWDYVKWDWNGHSSEVDNRTNSWYAAKPRKVLVTNPRTKKSIITVAAESGPAPYAGARGSASENGYGSPQRFTPANYTGRVSGLPPKAYQAIDAKQTENGEGDELLYAWAPDQNATPGPTDDTASDNTGVGGGCVCPDSTVNVKAGVATSTMKDFIKNYGQATFDVGKKYGIPYDAILAQAGLESGWGAATPQNSNNLFGIKNYPGWKGETVSAGTQEDDGSGNMTSTTAAFIKFNSVEEGIEGYAQFIHRNSRYATALKYPNNPVRYLEEIKKAGYATDSSYVSKVTAVLKTAQKYIKDNGLFIPSSQVQADGAPPPESNGDVDNAMGGCSIDGNGDAVATAIKYAWPEYHAPPYFDMKPEYKAAVQRAMSEGRYVGGGAHPGIDCGGFVTRAMQDSGVDDKYGGGGNTLSQEAYMKLSTKYELLNAPGKPFSSGDLQPGDIAINEVHTYMFVGDQGSFGSKIASASFSESGASWRTPMAGKEQPGDSSYRWYRIKS